MRIGTSFLDKQFLKKRKEELFHRSEISNALPAAQKPLKHQFEIILKQKCAVKYYRSRV